MSLNALVKSCVAVADSVVGSLQDAVVHHPWTSDTSHGVPQYGTSVSRQAVVDQTRKRRRDANGDEVWQTAKITFPRPITANGTSGRKEPVDPRDKFVLPDGSTGPIIEVMNGPINPATHAPYFVEVMLGE